MSPDHTYMLEKARNYCAYQERCLFDVQKKLESWMVSEEVSKKVLKELVKEGFLNEERFASVFATGKLRHNKWGKNKIIYALRQKQVPDIYIQIAVDSLDEEEYLGVLKTVISANQTPETQSYKDQAELVAYAQQKGFQPILAWKVVKGEI